MRPSQRLHWCHRIQPRPRRVSTSHRILMCPPDHFRVDYVINPWMAGQEGGLDLALAREQWEGLRALIGGLAEVVTLEARPKLPDMVFTANAGMVYGDIAVPSHFMPMERRPEETHYREWFRAHGFDVRRLPDSVGFEGAGDCLLDRGGPWLWTGYGFRTEIEAHPYLAEWFPDRELVSVRLTDARFYHIDTCMCPLSGGYLLYHPPAFDYDSRVAIETRVPPERRIVVDTLDAGSFACNAVNIDEHVILNRASPALQQALAAAGFVVHEVGLSEFLKAGGSAKCLTLRLSEPRAAPAS
ncbi:MAG: hypothetical protein JJT93_12845 [Gammaproteobacteria bacterium]|nr:hypothetical protein [Gammaproteobacteria bacterium]